MNTALLNELHAVLGDTGLLRGDLAAYETDWRRRYFGAALCVVKPSNTEEVAQAVKICAQAGVPIVPQGGNTSMVGGATPRDIRLTRLL